jgi:hypothetical protein
VEPETVELASTAATTIVALLATDAWGQVKEKVGALWRRFVPEQADAVEAELSGGHEEAGTAAEPVARALELYWESRLLRLLAADVAVAAELRRVLGDLESADQHRNVTIRQRAKASGQSTVVQVAGDATISSPVSERPGPRRRGPQ